MERRIIPTARPVQGKLVPTGDPVSIPGGTFVTLTQALGGSYTVIFNGNMARIDGADGDALGLTPETLSFEPPADGKIDSEQVDAALSSVFDPEIPVNIVDLGLIYGRRIQAGQVYIDMTLTAPAAAWGRCWLMKSRRASHRCPSSPAWKWRWSSTPLGPGSA